MSRKFGPPFVLLRVEGSNTVWKRCFFKSVELCSSVKWSVNFLICDLQGVLWGIYEFICSTTALLTDRESTVPCGTHDHANTVDAEPVYFCNLNGGVRASRCVKAFQASGAISAGSLYKLDLMKVMKSISSHASPLPIPGGEKIVESVGEGSFHEATQDRPRNVGVKYALTLKERPEAIDIE